MVDLVVESNKVDGTSSKSGGLKEDYKKKLCIRDRKSVVSTRIKIQHRQTDRHMRGS